MPGQGPVPIESRALGTLTYIRASIDSAGSLAVPGMAAIVMGVIGLAATALASLPALEPHWLGLWLIAAALALILGGALMARQHAQRRHRYFGPVRKFLLCLCPALGAGAALTLVMWHAGALHLIPGTWLLLYGCAVLSASTATSPATVRLILIMGALFVALGLIAFAVPPRWHTPMLGAGFGALHLVFGILIGRTSHDE